VNVLITGTFPDGTTVQQSFSLDGDVHNTETFTLSPAFSGVKYLHWNQLAQVDNICITAACEDGLDNDGDDLSDLADPDCDNFFDPTEHPPFPVSAVPALAMPARFLLVAILVIVGVLKLRFVRN
jgi:hypothetical protein